MPVRVPQLVGCPLMHAAAGAAQPDLDLVVAGRWRVRGPGSYLMAVCPESDQVVLRQEPATFLVFALSDMRLGVKWTPRVCWCSWAAIRYAAAMEFGAPGILLVLTWVEDHRRREVVVVDVTAQRRLGTLWGGEQPGDGTPELLTVSGDMVAVGYCMFLGRWDVIRIFRRDGCAGPVPSWTLVRAVYVEHYGPAPLRCLALSTCGAYVATVVKNCFTERALQGTWQGGGATCVLPRDWQLCNVIPYEGRWIAFGGGKYWYLVTGTDQNVHPVTATRVRARARPLALACIPGLGLLALERGGHLVLLQTRAQNAQWPMSAVRCAWMGAVVRVAANSRTVAHPTPGT